MLNRQVFTTLFAIGLTTAGFAAARSAQAGTVTVKGSDTMVCAFRLRGCT